MKRSLAGAAVLALVACADSTTAPTELHDILAAKGGKPALVNYALDFTTDYVQVADTDVLDLSTTYTLEAWVKPHDILGAAHQHFISKWGGGGNASYTMTAEGGYLAAGVHNGVDPTQVLMSSATLQDDVWQHVAVTMGDGTLRLYIDGVPDGVLDNSQIPMNSTQPLNFGQEHSLNFTGWSFDGQIDEIRIWNVTRSQKQLQRSMSKRLRGREKGLVGYWRFDDGTGATAFDATKNNLDGTIGGATWTSDAAPLKGY
jgi:hypothetical protein